MIAIEFRNSRKVILLLKILQISKNICYTRSLSQLLHTFKSRLFLQKILLNQDIRKHLHMCRVDKKIRINIFGLLQTNNDKRFLKRIDIFRKKRVLLKWRRQTVYSIDHAQYLCPLHYNRLQSQFVSVLRATRKIQDFPGNIAMTSQSRKDKVKVVRREHFCGIR